MSDKKVFEYNLMDAWHAPIYSVTIPESDQNIVYYAISAHRLFPDINGEIKTVEISDKARLLFTDSTTGIKKDGDE